MSLVRLMTHVMIARGVLIVSIAFDVPIVRTVVIVTGLSVVTIVSIM